jgi:hypothetical protein
LAKIVPFKFLEESLHVVAEVPSIAKELAALAAPKTEAEWSNFKQKAGTIAAKLDKLGVRVSGEDIKVDAFPKPIKNNIETLGYGENSLAELAELVKKAKEARWDSRDTDLSGLYDDKSLSKQERFFVADAYALIEGIIDVSARRAAKVVKLTKATTNAIKHFYK